jgi:predicted membrane protein
MNEIRHSHNYGRLVFGLVVLAFGLIFLLSNLNVIDSSKYFRFWPMVLIAFGLVRLLQPRHGSGRMFGLILASLGALLLLKDLGKIHFNIWALWPLALVLFGLGIVWDVLRGRSRWESSCRGPRVRVNVDRDGGSTRIDPDSAVNINCVFSGDKRIVTSQDFRGGTISTMMGGCELDLRQASISGGEAVLDTSVVFGGIELRVPEDWRVVLRVNATLGGVEDKTRKPAGEGGKTLMVTGNVTFGGLEVRN